ncbi:hypothetical protein D9756_009187 [Leucocoprinus leucothites]|uniref:DUF7918 domain-containing protein n=1 Tax=Leucocoprinus leucothites TaxID=201217 RepID=A0A8H5CYG6_9AGAR|nr:hypothetical protein D9756_009187 [Leucoagaricus leucothites]
MLTLDGMSISIRVDGVDIPEFTVERDLERKRVSCWVPSQVDKEFEVVVNSGTRARGPWAADVVADGARAYNPIFLMDQSCNVGYYQKSATVKRPFAFSKLELVDDDALLNSSQGTRIGEIEISCYTVEVTNSYYKPEYNTSFVDNSKVHEKSKKGLSEHVGFKKEVQGNPCKFYNARNLEYIGTFVFRYRPLAYLQAQGLAPAPGQVVPAANSQPRPPIPVINLAKPGKSSPLKRKPDPAPVNDSDGSQQKKKVKVEIIDLT